MIKWKTADQIAQEKAQAEQERIARENKQKAIEAAPAEIADLWYQNMILDFKLNDETANVYYEMMMMGGA